MELPTVKVKATQKNPKLFFLYGREKVGKTTILSQLDNNLILDLERGSSYVDALKMEINSLKELAEAGKMILDAGRPYKYISVDVVDKIEEWAEQKATEAYKASAIGKNFDGDSVLELPRGAGYLYLRIHFFNILAYIMKLADNVILVGHQKDTTVDKAGKEVSAQDIQLTGRIKSMVAAKSDAIGYLFRKDDKLMVTFETKDELTCGSRCDHLKGKTMEFDWKKIMIDK